MAKYLHYKKFVCKILTCWLPYKQRILYREALYWFSFSDYWHFKCANYKIVSLGSNCLPRGLATAIKLKPRRFYGEKSCVFDLSVNTNIKKIVHLIDNDFNDYFENLVVNEKTFPHDYDMPYNKFVERYKKRIANFLEIMKSDKIIYFIYSDYDKIPLKEEILYLYDVLKKKRNSKPFKLILLTSSYVDGLDDVIQIPDDFKITDSDWLVHIINEYKDYDNKYTQYCERMRQKLKTIISNTGRIHNEKGDGMSIVKPIVRSVVIACCTYKRPEKLEQLLASLIEMTPVDVPVKVLIVDNDKEKSAQTVCEKYKNKLDIHYVVEKSKGLANVRNRALKTAIELDASHIAFIDDDEIADKNWLVAHVDFYNRFENIYVSNGPVYFEFAENTPDYIIKNKIFNPYNNKQLGKIKRVYPSNNVFFALKIIKDNEIYFSKEFNSSGGEDTDFFTRISSLGCCIGWNYNAIVYEFQDENRTDIKWILKRAYNNGRITGYLKIKNNKKKKILYIADKCLKIIFSVVISIFSILLGKTVLLNNLVDVFCNSGKIVGASTSKLSNYYGEKE